MDRLSPSEAAAARSGAYRLLSHFFRDGLSPELRRQIESLPVVKDLLPEDAGEDAAAADHYGVLGLDVLPYASAYLEEDGRLGGRTSGFMARARTTLGLPLSGSEAADHVSSEMDVLSHLCGPGSESGRGTESSRLELDVLSHLVTWLPAFQHALAGTGMGLYAGMAMIGLEVAEDHLREIQSSATTRPDFQLPPAPDLIGDESAGVRELSGFLVRPALSGFVLTRSAIVAMGRDLGLPRGFGDRALMLGNLFGSAAAYDGVTDLVRRIGEAASEWERRCRELESSEADALSSAAATWRERVRHTLSVLEQIDLRLADSHRG